MPPDAQEPEHQPERRPGVVRPPLRRDSVVPPAEPVPHADPVRRRRLSRTDDRPTLQPELLSGRSLEAPRSSSRWGVLRRNRVAVVVVGLVLLVVIVAVGGKYAAERAADAAMQQRADELSELLGDATPEDFLAFGASVQVDGSLAQRVRDTDGFVNVRARAPLAFIRFQPSGWWSGFTERCLVAYVRPDGTTVETPKTSCVRVREPTR